MRRRGIDLLVRGGRVVTATDDFEAAVAIEGGRIVAIAPEALLPPADRVIDGKDRMLLPGLIDIHSHPEHEPLYRGVREEHGLRNMHMTGLYERSQAYSAPDEEARAASAEFAYCELLLSGVTKVPLSDITRVNIQTTSEDVSDRGSTTHQALLQTGNLDASGGVRAD